MNIAVVRGRLARPADARVLPSGDRMVGYEVTVEGPDGRHETVPVVWFAAPARAGTLDVGTEVVVVGRVRRRFFRANGAVASRTEVVADLALKASDRKVGEVLRGVARRVEPDPVGPVT